MLHRPVELAQYVTVVIDLTPIRDGTGPARLLDMVEGRSKQVFKTWLAARPQSWRDAVEVVAMDGFTGHLDLQGIRPSIGSVGDAYDCETARCRPAA